MDISKKKTVKRKGKPIFNAQTLMTKKMSADGYVIEKIAERARVDMAAWGVCGLSSPFI